MFKLTPEAEIQTTALRTEMDLHIMQCLLLEELKLLSQIVFSYFPSLLVGMLEKGFQLPV